MYSLKQVQAALNAVASSSGSSRSSGRKRRRRKRSSASGGSGTVTVSRRELLLTVKKTVQTVAFHPDKLPWLGILGGAFEMWRPTKAIFEYRSLSSTQVSGAVAFCLDWGEKDTKTTRQAILAHSPSVDTPVWRNARLVAPPNLLRTKNWFSCLASSAASERYSVSVGALGPDDDVGEIWVDYTVQFAGARSA